MQLKLKEFLALGSFAGWFMNFMKFKKVWAQWLFGIICLGSILFIIFDKDGGGAAEIKAIESSNSIPGNVAVGNSNSVGNGPQMNFNGQNNGIVAQQINPTNSPITQTINNGPLPEIVVQKTVELNKPTNGGFQSTFAVDVVNPKSIHGPQAHFQLYARLSPQLHLLQEPKMELPPRHGEYDHS